MKKYISIFVLFALLVLPGCDMKANETITCSDRTEANSITTDRKYVIDYKDNDIKKMKITYDYNRDVNNNNTAGNNDGTTNNNNNDNNNNNNNNGNDSSTSNYLVSGIAWIDENENGQRDSNEKLLEGIKVKLLDSKTNEFVKDEVEVIYIGNNLSAKKLSEVVNYIKDKSVYVNVISKSGTTLEIKLTYNYILNILKEKYDLSELKERIIVTTNQLSGYLKDEASKYGFMTFDMPSDIGGRYSIITPAHLLVLAVMNLDIDKFLKGYYEGKKYLDEAYNYACIRNVMYKLGFLLENFSVYHESLYYYTEFLKQLFGESEGKDGKGIFPVSTVNTRDLHSLGQFIQEGRKLIYETVIKAKYQTDVMMEDKSLNEYNDIVLNSVVEAHYDGGVPNNIIDMGIISLESIGQLTMFFMMASAFSAYLFDVDPFNQPGVEKYKNIMNSKISNF